MQMLVSPIEELTNMEGLSQNGETEREQEGKGSEEEGEEEKSEDEKDGRSEGRASVGLKSPKKNRREWKEKSTKGHTAHTAVGVNTV